MYYLHRSKNLNGFCTFCLVAIFFLVRASVSLAQDNIVGEWSGKDSDGDAVTMLFNADKSAEVLFEGLPRLSAKNLVGGYVSWLINPAHDPMHLDIIILKNSVESGRLRMLARFIDNKTLDIRNSRDMTTRPIGFDVTDTVYQILLTRQ